MHQGLVPRQGNEPESTTSNRERFDDGAVVCHRRTGCLAGWKFMAKTYDCALDSVSSLMKVKELACVWRSLIFGASRYVDIGTE
jgi:hypothetical protein